MRPIRHFLIALPLCAILLAGCTAPAGPGLHAGDSYIVNTQRTLFYLFGPAQAGGPDFALNHGERLTMLSKEYGYSHVAVQGTGQSGYVATEDLVPAPALAHASPAAAAAVHRRPGSHGASARQPSAAEQSQIPLPEFPESKPPPESPPFRY